MIDIDERAEQAGESVRAQARRVVARMPHPSEGRGQAPHRRLLAAASGVAIAAVAVTMVLSGGSAAPVIDGAPDSAAPVAVDGVLPVPDPGGVHAAYLADGTPVFVSRPADGEVFVLDAVDPHRGYRASGSLVAYCSSSGWFEDLYHGSKFTARGHWLGGPAPTGLAAYPVEIAPDGSTVRVTGPAGDPPARGDTRDEQPGTSEANCSPEHPGAAHRPAQPLRAISGRDIPDDRWSWAAVIVGGEPGRLVACDTDGSCPPDAPLVAADVRQDDDSPLTGAPSIYLARTRTDGIVELLRPAIPDDHGIALPRPTDSADTTDAVRLSDDEVVVLAAAATDDPSLKDHVAPDTDGLASVWRMGTVSGTPPTVPDGHIGVLVFARQAKSTCRSVEDVLGVEIRNGMAVVVLDADGEFLQACPGPDGAAAWTAFAVAIPDRYIDALTGADTRVAGGGSQTEGSAWVDDEAKEAWDAEHGPATWVAGYFLPSDFAYDSFDDGQLVRRWRRITFFERDSDRAELLAEALAALPGASPAGVDNSWQPYPGSPERRLALESVRLDGDEVVLDFSELVATAPGSAAAMAMGLQFDGIVAHYYPEAGSICVLIDGEPSEWLHDEMTCPSRE